MNPCIVIPVFRHASSLERYLPQVIVHGIPILLVDDGNSIEEKNKLQELTQRFASVQLISLSTNRGKGSALTAGFEEALRYGYTHAVQVDADGQHDAADISTFLEEAREHPSALVLGVPTFDSSAPRIRLWGRKLSVLLGWIESGSRALKDPLCGFRVYPLSATVDVLRNEPCGVRMDFDPEIATRLLWKGIPLRNVSTKVIYPQGGVSNFDYVKDNARLVALHLRLLKERFFTQRRTNFSSATIHRFSPWYRNKEQGSTGGLVFLYFFYRLVGRTFARKIIQGVSLVIALFSLRARQASKDFLTKVSRYNPSIPTTLGAQIRQIQEFGVAIFDKVAAWRGDITFQEVQWHDYHELKSLLQEGKGAVVLSAHLGNIEVTRAVCEQYPHVRVNALMFLANAAKFNSFLKKYCPHSHIRVFPIEEITPTTIVDLQECINRGELLCMLADRVLPGSATKKVEVEFLGENASFPQGPFILASLLEAPVFLSFCVHSEGTYHAFFEPFSSKLSFPRTTSHRKGRSAALKETTQRFAKRLEEYAIRYPFQWFNFYHFWHKES